MEEELCVVEDGLVVISDAQGVILADDVGFLEIEERFVVKFGKHNPLCFRLLGTLDTCSYYVGLDEILYPTMSTSFILVQRSHPQRAYMASDVIARRNGRINNRICTYKAHHRLRI